MRMRHSTSTTPVSWGYIGRIGRMAAACLALSIALLFATGCETPMRGPSNEVLHGDFGAARSSLASELPNPGHRDFLLTRLRLGVLSLADGYPESAELVLDEVYDTLRALGVNRGRTFQAALLNEDTRVWKGEPSEQALALAYYAMTQAELGAWDNVRAAIENAQFYLRDLENERPVESAIDTRAVAQRDRLYQQALREGLTPEEARVRTGLDPEGGDFGYVAQGTRFTLGYLLSAVANQQLGREDEASDHLNQALRIDPNLRPLVDALRTEAYNTLLVVSWGLGPSKEAYDPDRTRAVFMPRFPSNEASLIVEIDGATRTYPLVLDYNRFANAYIWGGWQDFREGKSAVGSGLVLGGLIAAAMGAEHRSNEALLAGLGAAATGAFLKAGSHADMRYVDVYPQRFYIVPLNLPAEPTPIQLQVQGYHSSRLVLTGLEAGDSPEAQLRYVRLVSGHMVGPSTPPAWATSGRIHYSNPHAVVADDPAHQVPYLLGGRDVRRPTERTMDAYQRAGVLRSMTANELRELYRLEGIDPSADPQIAPMHVLEGGQSLVAPLPGTAGFARLFGQIHPPYTPRTQRVAEVASQIEEAGSARAQGASAPAQAARP